MTDKAESVSVSDFNFLDIFLKKCFSTLIDTLLKSLYAIALCQLGSLLFKRFWHIALNCEFYQSLGNQM